MPLILIIFGPPGSGKGTQAAYLKRKLKISHFDSGVYLRKIVFNARKLRDPLIRRQRAHYLAGELMDSSWILRTFKEEIGKILKLRKGIVVTGTPRTLYEAFGNKKTSGIIQFYRKTAADSKIVVFWLEINLDEATKRNVKRGRPDDKPEIIKVRFKEYKKRTLPILKELKKRRIKVVEIDAARSRSQVFKSILNKLSQRQRLK